MGLASVNWTTVGAAAVTGLTAIAVALSGYFGARLTAGVTKRGIEEETRRAREEREEAHRGERAAIYGRILSTERALRDWRFRAADTSERAPDEAVVLDDQGESLRHSLLNDLDTIILSAPHAVADAAVTFIEEVWTLRLTGTFSFHELEEQEFGVLKVGPGDWGSVGRTWIAKRSVLINAMRSDLASDNVALRNLRKAVGEQAPPRK